MQWRNKLGKVAVILLLVPQLMACAVVANAQKRLQAILDSAESQCDFAAAVTTPTLTENGFKVVIDNHSPACDNFAEGKSYYAMVPIKPNATLHISSEAYNPALYFKPILRFYDANFNAEKTLIPELHPPKFTSYLSQERVMQGTVMTPSNAHYLLIYTSSTFLQTWDYFTVTPGRFEAVRQNDHYVQRQTPSQTSLIYRGRVGTLTINYIE